MRILIVEDDTIQAPLMLGSLRRAFPGDEIGLIRTESEFHESFPFMPDFDVIVLDVMLPWSEPRPDMLSPPEQVLREGYFRAGFRCQKLLAENEKTKDIPVILYTILEKADLEIALTESDSTAIYLRKESEFEPLIDLIRQRVRRR